ncbi:protein ALP1-like [Cyprinus carpio]|uniref:Protein ALP1-like n=1 Tax=Cyprinus carpio TaxID=7962 RepID=A0A9R0AUD5_CYPCA|nr:protein ALP1-like [Cyprinus carpio]
MSKAVIGILRQLIAFPSADDLEAVGAGFAQLAGSPAFRVVAGAIDGCHICIKPPASDVQCCFNRKLFNSVQLQAITDHQGKFLDIFVGYPGSVHDARVLKNSPVYTGCLFPPAGKCILGDGGYPFLSVPICLMAPYREPVQNAVQQEAFSCTEHRREGLRDAENALAFHFLLLCQMSLHAARHSTTCLSNGDIVDPEVAEDDDGPAEPT